MNYGLVSLTFDDALDQHLDQALPILEEHGLTGTFYTHLAAPGFCRRMDEWRQAAQRGHELGNHTIFHPADARKPWVREGNALDRYTLDRMHFELQTASDILHGIDGRAERTFAYPCSNSILGRRGLVKAFLFQLGFERTRLPGLVDRLHLDIGSGQKSYVPLVRDLFVAARGGGLVLESCVPPLDAFDEACLPSAAVEGWTFSELTGFVERALNAGTWAILQFHGIGGGHRMDCDLRVFRDFVAWLADRHADHVTTVLDGIRKLGPPSRHAPHAPDCAKECHA